MEDNAYSILKHCIKHTATWVSVYDSILAVGLILRNEGIINSVISAFDYFERPWHYEPEMKGLIKEYEIDLVSEDFFSIIPDGREVALQWLLALDVISGEAYDLLWDDMEDKL